MVAAWSDRYRGRVLLAELEVFHSRPIAPTRRVALGAMLLPTSPAPGFGGLLLGGIVARFVGDLDPELLPELDRLTHQLEAGARIPQPRLRHRFQDDRVGLTAYRHMLIGDGEDLHFDIDEAGTPAPNVLGAVYAAGRSDPGHRGAVFTTIRRGLRWRGEPGPKLVQHLTDARTTTRWATLGGRDPVAWALETLGLPEHPDRSTVQRGFRDQLRLAHPDHGGEAAAAARRIDELAEARRILLGG